MCTEVCMPYVYVYISVVLQSTQKFLGTNLSGLTRSDYINVCVYVCMDTYVYIMYVYMSMQKTATIVTCSIGLYARNEGPNSKCKCVLSYLRVCGYWAFCGPPQT